MAKGAKRGRPKLPGTRVTVVLRMDARVADFSLLAGVAHGWSRAQFVQRVLERLEHLADYGERLAQGEGVPPQVFEGLMGEELGGVLAELGLAGEGVRGMLQAAREDRAAFVAGLRREGGK